MSTHIPRNREKSGIEFWELLKNFSPLSISEYKGLDDKIPSTNLLNLCKWVLFFYEGDQK